MLWSGTAASAVDLHNFLSSDYIASGARSIDANGNIVGYAIYAPPGQSGQYHAIEWVVVPEPSTSLLVIGGLLGLGARRRAARA